MSVPQEATSALFGALKLARFDATGVQFFNASRQGFFNSFIAAAVIAPFFMLFMGIKWQGGFVETGAVRLMVVESSVYVISWVLFPLVMVYVTRHFGWWPRFYAFGTARNWTVLVQNILYLPIAIADISGLMPLSASAPLLQMMFVYTVAYSWFVTRHTLGVSGMAATAIVMMDLALAIILQVAADLLQH